MIAEDMVLRTRVALKGGTALNRFQLAVHRLSGDIDLNYIGALTRAEMEADRPAVEAALSSILAALGYQIRRLPDKRAGGKWTARFGSALGGGSTLEVGPNFMAREPPVRSPDKPLSCDWRRRRHRCAGARRA